LLLTSDGVRRRLEMLHEDQTVDPVLRVCATCPARCSAKRRDMSVVMPM
jgi:hypothetical protein